MFPFTRATYFGVSLFLTTTGICVMGLQLVLPHGTRREGWRSTTPRRSSSARRAMSPSRSSTRQKRKIRDRVDQQVREKHGRPIGWKKHRHK